MRERERERLTSGGGKNLAEALVGVPEILVIKPTRRLGILRLGGGVLAVVVLRLLRRGGLLLLLGVLGVGVGHGVEETSRGVGLELEVAIVIADDPGDEELAAVSVEEGVELRRLRLG